MIGGNVGPPTSWDAGPAPQWFVAAPAGQWLAVAGGATQTVRAVLPSPVPHVDGAPDGPGSIMAAWAGGGVDQVRGELLLVANGGHADYPGNEAYAISLREAQPSWRRLSDPTPNALLHYAEAATPLGALNGDGRPRAMHSTFEVFGDDRMWFVYQNSFTNPAGDSTSACFSYDRTFAGVPGPGQPPLGWTMANLGPWTIHPDPDINWTSGFGVAAWDRVDHKVWGLGGNNNVNFPEHWSVDTIGPTTGVTHRYRVGGSLDNFNSWVAVAHDLRLLVAGGSFNGAVYVLHLDRPAAPDAWERVTNITGTGSYTQGAGGAYVISNHAIAVGNPVMTGGTIFRLQIPTAAVDGGVAYDPTGTWAWTTLTPGGAQVSTAAGNSGAYSKWNIVEDMGSNTSALVFVGDIDGPVYVYKLPPGGL